MAASARVTAVRALHVRETSRAVGVLEDDGQVRSVDEVDAILSTVEYCGECRKSWPCRTALALDDTREGSEAQMELSRLLIALDATYTPEGVTLHLRRLANDAERLAGGPALGGDR